MFRILYILSNEPNGGVGAVIENYVSHFHDRFIVDYLIYTDQRDTPFQKTIRTENNRIYYLPELRIRDYLSLQQKTNRFFREYARDYCIAHLHFAGIASLVYKPAKKYGLPCRITHSHNPRLSDSAWKELRNRMITGDLKKVSNEYFACSKDAGRYLFGDSPVYYMHNAIDPEVFRYDEQIRRKTREQYGIPDKHVVLFSGRLEKQKNPERVIDIFSKFAEKDPEAVLLMAGSGSLDEQLHRQAEKTGKDIRFLGYTREIAALNQAADVVLLPSEFEGFGISAIEAQVSGLPCVLSDRFPEEVDITDGVVHLSLNEEDSVWAEALHMAVQKQRADHRQEIIDAGYDIHTEAEKLEDYYEELAKKYGGRQ